MVSSKPDFVRLDSGERIIQIKESDLCKTRVCLVLFSRDHQMVFRLTRLMVLRSNDPFLVSPLTEDEDIHREE